MTKQEQIDRLKQTIQDAKEQVERLEEEEQESKFPEKLISGMVVAITHFLDKDTPHVCVQVDSCPAQFVFQELHDSGRYDLPRSLKDCKEEYSSIKVLANTVEEYYAKR